MHKVVLWGGGNGYEDFVRYNGYDKVNVVGLVDKACCSYLKQIDGIPVLHSSMLMEIDYDYIIISVRSKQIYEEILDEINKIGIQRELVIPLWVFEIPFFSFDQYIEIKKSNLSILSDYCFGGYLYHSFGLEFKSPTINMFCDNENYYRLISDIPKYLCSSFKEIHDTIDYRYTYPRGILAGDCEWCFNHDDTFESAIKKWERRVKRFNYDNYLVLMTIESDEMAYRFNELNIKNKLAFYWKDIPELESVLYVPGWNNPQVRKLNSYSFPQYINNLSRDNKTHRLIDWQRVMSLDLSNLNRGR